MCRLASSNARFFCRFGFSRRSTAFIGHKPNEAAVAFKPKVVRRQFGRLGGARHGTDENFFEMLGNVLANSGTSQLSKMLGQLGRSDKLASTCLSVISNAATAVGHWGRYGPHFWQIGNEDVTAVNPPVHQELF